MSWLKRFCILVSLLPLMQAQWYNSANFYQIYPRSYVDSNGDGVGDLQGIKTKLQYIKDLGMDGLWLSPIFKSPMADFGYDISDFRDIHNEFGTMQDFDELSNECKKIGLRLILDFVPNHSSDEHEWFKKSERREPGYEDYYIWRDAKVHPVTNSLVPPTNWMSTFRFSAWRWSDTRQQMYYHMFHYKQPDLNYRNPKLVQEMKDILTYWMEKGVDGFRIDAIPSLFERMNSDGSFPDEPRSYNPNCDRYDECSLNHTSTIDQEETYDMAYQWRKLVDDFSASHNADPKVLMTESYSRIDLTQRYYGNGVVEGSHIPFNFELMKRVNLTSTAEDYKSIIEEWLNMMPPGHMANWVVSA
jgi:alpha-glucosidase